MTKNNIPKDAENIKGKMVLLHDIRSIHNVASIFRTSDGAGVEKIYLTGYSPCPVDRFGRPQKGFAKVSLGAENSVSWEYEKEPRALLTRLKKQGVSVVAVEQDERSELYSEMKDGKKVPAKIKYPAIFVFGNEVGGVDKKILDLADKIIEIPMRGVKESLNVSVSVGIILFSF
ncbi:MAG: TrmH family RNA methyltransferase [Candidatus Taylorbacteria bacterium]|nr:TrmH family RNA methyltransferase [Candidatus Taylorbacteria bacterium]